LPVPVSSAAADKPATLPAGKLPPYEAGNRDWTLRELLRILSRHPSVSKQLA